MSQVVDDTASCVQTFSEVLDQMDDAPVAAGVMEKITDFCAWLLHRAEVRMARYEAAKRTVEILGKTWVKTKWRLPIPEVVINDDGSIQCRWWNHPEAYRLNLDVSNGLNGSFTFLDGSEDDQWTEPVRESGIPNVKAREVMPFFYEGGLSSRELLAMRRGQNGVSHE